MGESLKILSMNCRGLSDNSKRMDVFNKLRKSKHDIYCLQDTHIEEKLDHIIRAEWGLSGVFISGNSSNKRGVMILFNNTFEYKILKVKKDINGNYNNSDGML